MPTFGERFRQLRIENDKTLDDMKEILQTTKATLSRYENSKLTPKIDFAKKAANYFNVSLDYIMGNNNVKNNKSLTHEVGVKPIDEVYDKHLEQKIRELAKILDIKEIKALESIKSEGYDLKDLHAALKMIEFLQSKKKE